MPATPYRMWAYGNTVRIGNNRATDYAVAGVGKCASPGSPYEVINEVICSDLGRALRLPIPPGTVAARDSDKVLHYVSLDFGEAGQKLPPANARSIADENPQLACGVIIFDLWIGNCDRHNGNLSYDEKAEPHSLQLFDQGYALLGTDGVERLKKLDDKEVLDSHCLTAELSAMDGFDFWNDRIKSLPKWFIVEVVNDAVKIGLEPDDAKATCDFLLNRRSGLKRIIKKHKKEFFNVRQQMLPGMGAGLQ